MRYVLALFGESEKGAFKTPHILKALPQLMDRLGNPPKESEGISFAVQALLYERELIYFRVAEEGFSKLDYFHGLKYLQERKKRVHALCLPGVADQEILEASRAVCDLHSSFLVFSQKDLYDYLMS